MGIQFYENKNTIRDRYGKNDNFLNILMNYSNGDEEEIIDYMLENGCEFDDYIVYNSMLYGSSLLKTFHKNNFELTEEVCIRACRHFNLECLQYAIQNGCEYGDKEYLKKKLECHYYYLSREQKESKLSFYRFFCDYIDSLE